LEVVGKAKVKERLVDLSPYCEVEMKRSGRQSTGDRPETFGCRISMLVISDGF
jgi:hypothetical protein